MILPRRGRTACVLRSRPCFAEPPAESPSTMKISRCCGSRSEQSASFADSPSSSTPFRRVNSRALRSAFARVDVVGEGEDVFLVAVVVLQRDLDLDVALLALEVEHLGMDGRLVLVEVLDELDDAAPVKEGVAALVAFVLDDDLEALVEESQLAETVAQRVEREARLLEDLRVRLEADDRAVLRRLLAGGQLGGRDTAIFVALCPNLAVAANLNVEPLTERVDDRNADAVQASGHLVGRVLELAPLHGLPTVRRSQPATDRAWSEIPAQRPRLRAGRCRAHSDRARRARRRAEAPATCPSLP